jgi:hypothetical protein
MKRRGLVALAVVAAAMAAYLVIDGRRRPVVTERTAGRTRLAPAFDRAKVRYITIRRQGGESFSLLHSPSPTAPPPAPAWQVEMDGSPPADDAAVEDLLSAVDLAESDRIADVTPQAAGVDPAAVQIDVETPTGAFALRLGRADATGQGVYARAGSDGPIRVIGRRLFDLVNREPGAFRDRRLFPVDPAAITSIAWRGEDGAAELTASGGRWQNARKERVAPERVAEALRRLLALRIDKLEPGTPGARATGRTLAMTAGEARVALEAGKDGALTRGNERVWVPAEAFEAAWRSLAAAAARDDRLISQPPETVTRVALHDDRGRLELRRASGGWTFTAPKVTYAADTQAVDAWLARLGAVKAATRAGGANTRHLIVEGRFREEADVSSPAEVYALLAPDPSRFRERAVLSFARFDLRRLQRRAGKTTQMVTTDDGGTWRGAAGASVDPASVGQVAGALADLRAEEFLAAPPAGQPSVTWEIEVQPPGERKPLRRVLETWTRKGPGPGNDGCVARLDKDATFRPERATCDALRLDLLKTAE